MTDRSSLSGRQEPAASTSRPKREPTDETARAAHVAPSKKVKVKEEDEEDDGFEVLYWGPAGSAPSQARATAGPSAGQEQPADESESDLSSAEPDSDYDDKAESRFGQRWTAEEDALLDRLTDEDLLPNGNADWDKIALSLPGRTPARCQVRLRALGKVFRRIRPRALARSESPFAPGAPSEATSEPELASSVPLSSPKGPVSLRGVPWAAEDEARLIGLHNANLARYGSARWDLITPHFPGRTLKACCHVMTKDNRARALAAARATLATPVSPTPPPHSRPASPAPGSGLSPDSHPASSQPSQIVVAEASSDVEGGAQGTTSPPTPAAALDAQAATAVEPVVAGQEEGRAWTAADDTELLDAVEVAADPTKVTTEEWTGIGRALKRTKFECAVRYKKLARAGRGVEGAGAQQAEG